MYNLHVFCPSALCAFQFYIHEIWLIVFYKSSADCSPASAWAGTLNCSLIHYAPVNCEVFASVTFLQQACFKNHSLSRALQIHITKQYLLVIPEPFPLSDWELQHHERLGLDPINPLMEYVTDQSNIKGDQTSQSSMFKALKWPRLSISCCPVSSLLLT